MKSFDLCWEDAAQDWIEQVEKESKRAAAYRRFTWETVVKT